jgi:bifunctional UDP-N-acetylglucosamine pyrophosphorylase/glucosamine-1-phosphate N-acetyltransferase
MKHWIDVVVLAAGRGKRMHSDMPKVLHPIGGRPMLEHVLNTVLELSSLKSETWELKAVHLVRGFAGDSVQASIEELGLRAAFQAQDIELFWHEQIDQRGTGHAVMQAQEALAVSGHSLVLFGDVPLIEAQSLCEMIGQAFQAGAGREDRSVILTAMLDKPKGYGRILRETHSHAVIGIVEERDATEAQRQIAEINSGMMLLPNRHLGRWLAKLSHHNAQGEYYLTDVIAMAHAEGYPVIGFPLGDALQIQGVNTLAQLMALERAYQRRLADRLLAQGVRIMDPDRFDVRGTLECDAGVCIDVNVIFQGHVLLRRGARVGANCVLIDTEIHEDAEILPFTHCESAVIGARSRVGPYARLRPGTELGEDNHVGNFVEFKAAKMGAHSKANHLAYVGDALIGSRVNIGAGTITCNYDGAHKHQTVIEDDAFIGSDSQLVAPVRVGAGATLGAGTTLTKDAPAGELTVSRAKQTTVSGWQRPRKSGKP